MHFLPHFWVKIGSKTVKMHRFYPKTCALIKKFSLIVIEYPFTLCMDIIEAYSEKRNQSNNVKK